MLPYSYHCTNIGMSVSRVRSRGAVFSAADAAPRPRVPTTRGALHRLKAELQRSKSSGGSDGTRLRIVQVRADGMVGELDPDTAAVADQAHGFTAELRQVR
jgi:hypothetical protein